MGAGDQTKSYRINNTAVLRLCQGDLSSWDVDAIVNAGQHVYAHLPQQLALPLLTLLPSLCAAANQRMLGGGGVDGGELRCCAAFLTDSLARSRACTDTHSFGHSCISHP